jgi:spermidine synthase
MVWIEMARAVMPGGDVLTLRKNGAEFEIRFNLFELMASRNSVSEKALARAALARIDGRAVHVLIGGLGMGYTASAALDLLGRDSRITVAELVPEVIAWNRGPLADLAGRPLDDSRATIHEGDVADAIRANPGAFDAILMDVDNGPEAVFFASNGFLYSVEGTAFVLTGLKAGGVLAVWSADRSENFERVLETGGFAFERADVDVLGGGGPAHAIYLVRKP